MKSISPVRLWTLSDLYYINPKTHENSENISISMQVGLSDKARQMLSNEIHKSCPIMDFK